MFKKLMLMSAFTYSLFGGNLTDLVEKAIVNKIVESSEQDLQSTKLEYESLKNSYLPSFSVGADLSSSSHESSGVPDEGMNTYAKFEFNVYDGGGKQHKYDRFDSEIKGQHLDIDGLKNRITLEVITDYYKYLALAASKESKSQEIVQLQEQYRKKKKLFEAETIAIDEVKKIRSRLDNATVSLHGIELDMQTVLHTLEYTIGEKVSVDIGSNIKPFENNQAELLAEIKALEYKMKTILSNAKAEKSSIYPQVNLDNTFTNYNENYNNDANDADLDNQNIVSLNLSWKIYDFDTTNKAYEANYKKYLALKSRYEYDKNRADTELRLAYKAYEIAKLKIASAESGLNAANSTFKSIEAKFENSIVDNVTYLEALSEQHEALSLLKATKFDLQVKRANIIYLSGKTLANYID